MQRINKAPMLHIDHLMVKQTLHGLMMFLDNDQFIGHALDVYGEFSQAEGELFEQIVEKGWTVIDGGANIGVHTVHLSRLVGEMGTVIAFEPQPVIHTILKTNLLLNGCRNAHAYQEGLGDLEGYMDVPNIDYDKGGNFGGVSLNSRGQLEADKVHIRTLDETIPPQGIDLIKLDLEGMEVEAIKGGLETLRNKKPILYVENDRRPRSKELIRLLASLDYTMFWHMPPLYRRNNLFNVERNEYPNIVSVNMLCWHPDEWEPGNEVIKSMTREVQGVDDWPLRGRD